MLTAANDARRAFIPGGHGSAWEGLKPAAAGFDPRKLEAAVALAVANDSPWPRSLYYPDGRYVGSVEWEETGPWSEIVGPSAPSPTNERYGYLWWLNRGSQRYRSAPDTCVYAMGAGSNIIWVDREHDLVAVLRWIAKGAVGDFLAKLLAAVE
jgi:hypothetical protein